MTYKTRMKRLASRYPVREPEREIIMIEHDRRGIYCHLEGEDHYLSAAALRELERRAEIGEILLIDVRRPEIMSGWGSLVVYLDEDGLAYDRDPNKPGAKQISRAELDELGRRNEIILYPPQK